MRGAGIRRVVGAVSLLALVACTPRAPVAEQPEPPGRLPEIGAAPAIDAADLVVPDRPNIVLVLLDDVSMELVPTMRHVRAMKRRGAAYPQAFVVDSLCCVSRASLLTGQYPHQTGVLTNTANTPNDIGPVGGWEAFQAYGNGRRSVNLALQRAGYATGFVGKFLNQYESHLDPLPVPPGWTEWNAIFGSAYDGWDFTSTYLDGDGVHLRDHPAPPAYASDEEKDAAYVGTVTTELALDFIAEQQDAGTPYFLEIAPYAAHGRVGREGAYADEPVFPPAMQDRPRRGRPAGNCGLVACTDLGLDDIPGFGDDPTDNAPRRADGTLAPGWRPRMPPPSAEKAVRMLRDRARMVQSVDRMLGEVLEAVDEDTYVVFTSDNGYHLGQHSLGYGKGSAYDSDSHVPLVVVGPGVLPGERDELATNLDLAPTFERLAGLRPAAYRSGRSLLPSLRAPDERRREAVILEHTWAPSLGPDPDKSYSGGTIDKIPSYVAARSADGLLVRVDLDNSWAGTSYAWEFYDYRTLAWERTNEYAEPRHQPVIDRLAREIERFDSCARHTHDDPVPATCRH